MLGMFDKTLDRGTVFNRGFPVGFHQGTTKKNSKHYLYNHIRIIIQFHDDFTSENPGGEAKTTKVTYLCIYMYIHILLWSYMYNYEKKYLYKHILQRWIMHVDICNYLCI